MDVLILLKISNVLAGMRLTRLVFFTRMDMLFVIWIYGHVVLFGILIPAHFRFWKIYILGYKVMNL